MLVRALKMTGGSPRDFVHPAWMDMKQPKIEEDKAKMNLKAIHEQKIKDRKRVQHLIDDANMSLENVKKETKDAKTANKKEDIAKSIISEAQ